MTWPADASSVAATDHLIPMSRTRGCGRSGRRRVGAHAAPPPRRTGRARLPSPSDGCRSPPSRGCAGRRPSCRYPFALPRYISAAMIPKLGGSRLVATCELPPATVTIASEMMPWPFERREVVVIVNPAAHNAAKRKALAAANEWLRDHGWKAEWAETSEAGEAKAVAAMAAEHRVPLVFVCGGDGTLNEAVNGLAGSETAVSVIPSGTVNLWAREMGLLKKPAEAVRLAVQGVRRRIDLGRAGSRY